MKTRYFLMVLAICGAAACNPTRRIVMKNETGSPAKITFRVKEFDDARYQSIFTMNNARETSFELTPQKPRNKISWSFGEGAWEPEYLKKIVQDLELLKIASFNDTTKLATEQEILAYLMSKRTGLGKRKIVLTIKN